MKILILSHNPICTHNNMGATLLSLFSAFRKDELCQLYIHQSLPDVEVCESYYRITDRQVLLGQSGGPVQPQSGAQGGSFQKPSRHTPLMRLLRDDLWKLGRWNTPPLRAWLDAQAPDRIFVAPGYAKFLMDMALKIARQRHIPIYTYLCDDYYFLPEPKGFLARQQRKLLQEKIAELLTNSRQLVTISPSMQARYRAAFSVPCTTVMTGSAIPPQTHPAAERPAQCITYFGNLSRGREESLIQVAKTLEAINRRLGTAYTLALYTAQPGEALQASPVVQFHGFVTGADFDRAFASAQLLLHTESFDGAHRALVKDSVSAKIPRSLASGIPLLVYGPAGIASVDYLAENRCVFVATGPKELEAVLLVALRDTAQRSQMAEAARQVAIRNHDSHQNSLRLKRLLEA